MEEKKYWSIESSDGRPALCWDCTVNGDDHSDFIEMSGLYSSFIVKYGIESGKAVFGRQIVFPMLRIFPNDTFGSYRLEIDNNTVPEIHANGRPVSETARSFRLNGTVECNSVYEESGCRLGIERVFFPTVDKQAVCEMVTVYNRGADDITISLSGNTDRKLDGVVGPMGAISAMIHANVITDGLTAENAAAVLHPDRKAVVSIVYSGRLAMQNDPADGIDIEKEYVKRLDRVADLMSAAALDTGNELFDTMFAFCKVRAGESIFRTRNGDIHSPGGGVYYAAVWCNDQAEYAGPWQAYTGDELQIKAGYNGYAWYFPFMDDSFDDPIPSSVIAEGTDFWNGAGDRGDAAMYLYGASRYALTCGNLGGSRELWNAILWCAGYCLSRKNESGVILSDSDELEGRLPSGKANLCTNMLTLGGLRYASRIAAAIGDTANAARFLGEARPLEIACEKYFAANIRGFDTYRYYEGNTTLRSWICMPLCVDVYDHADGTVDAITSAYLMSDAGQLSEEGAEIAWDRSTLYGIRGMFRAGKNSAAWSYLQDYCSRRLIGRHVPYPVEAWPEGGMRHLSAESALFCQIVTEGILAIDPHSFGSFSFVPKLPDGMEHLVLSNIHAFGQTFSITVDHDGWSVKTASGKTYSGTSTERQTIEF